MVVVIRKKMLDVTIGYYFKKFNMRGIIMIELRKITDDNFDECIKLEPKEEQKSFVAANVRSLAEAYVALANNVCIPLPFAVYTNDVVVGFIMLAYFEASEYSSENSYWICRLMIDKKYQGNGYGKETVSKTLELIRNFPCGEASVVNISYEPENVAAKKLYSYFGFVETGKVEEGEIVAVLSL